MQGQACHELLGEIENGKEDGTGPHLDYKSIVRCSRSWLASQRVCLTTKTSPRCKRALAFFLASDPRSRSSAVSTDRDHRKGPRRPTFKPHIGSAPRPEVLADHLYVRPTTNLKYLGLECSAPR